MIEVSILMQERSNNSFLKQLLFHVSFNDNACNLKIVPIFLGLKVVFSSLGSLSKVLFVFRISM